MLDYVQLRRDLIDYFGTATPMYPEAFMDVIDIQSATHSKLEHLARDNGFDLSDYLIKIEEYFW